VRLRVVGDPAGDDDEHVPAEAGDDVAETERVCESPGEGRSQLLARRAHPVELEKQHRGGFAAGAKALQRDLDGLLHATAVRPPEELVLGGTVRGKLVQGVLMLAQRVLATACRGGGEGPNRWG